MHKKTDGMIFEEAVEAAKNLEESHVDCIEISCGLVGCKEGLPNRVITRKEEEGLFFLTVEISKRR